MISSRMQARTHTCGSRRERTVRDSCALSLSRTARSPWSVLRPGNARTAGRRCLVGLDSWHSLTHYLTPRKRHDGTLRKWSVRRAETLRCRSLACGRACAGRRPIFTACSRLRTFSAALGCFPLLADRAIEARFVSHTAAAPATPRGSFCQRQRQPGAETLILDTRALDYW